MTLQCVIHYQHLKTTSKIIPLNQHKFQILNQNREARHKLGGENTHEQQSESIPPSFDSSKHGAHTECYKKFTMGLKIAKRKSEEEGTSLSTTAKRVRRSGEGAKQLFPKHCMICKHSGAIKVKNKKQFPRFLTLQISADAIVRFANMKEDEDMLKVVCDVKLLEREFMVHDKFYREYTRLPKDETVRCLKFHIKNANTKCLVFVTISA